MGRPKLVVDACNKLLSIYTKDEFVGSENEAALFSRPPAMDKATVPQRWVGTTGVPCGSLLATCTSTTRRDDATVARVSSTMKGSVYAGKCPLARNASSNSRPRLDPFARFNSSGLAMV